jgi:hypothetical protein
VTHFNLKDFLPGTRIRHHRHVAMLEVLRLIGPHTSVAHEQDIVMYLIGVPLILCLRRIFRVRPGGGVKLLVFVGLNQGRCTIFP